MSINVQNDIEVNNLSFKYGTEVVLENISFTVAKGDYLGVIGPNGGGKTTLMKIILGLLKPYEGEVKILGKDLPVFKDKFRVGYVPQRISQNVSQFPATVSEVVITGRTARAGVFGRLGAEDLKAADWAMGVTDVYGYRNDSLAQLSGGELQRVFIARALASKSEILILDEPTVGVDIGVQEKFYRLLRELNKDLKLTILFVTHDIEAIVNEAKYVLCLNKDLVCHTFPKELMKEGVLEKLYGRNVKMVSHDH